MRHTSDEAGLVADAEAALGEPVLAAGMFGCQNLLGAGIGGALATKAAAADQGVTVKLVVAVTAGDIHVLRWDGGADPRRVVHTFHRATTTVDVKRFGLSRVVTLTDSARGEHGQLHASVAPYARQTGPDQDVLAVLTA